MSNEQELIWVDKDFAERHKELMRDKSKRDIQVKVFDDYLEKIKDSSKQDFKGNLDNLEEDIAIYTGLMLKVKQAFEKAKDEQLSASYALWEKFDKELPYVSEKIEKIIATLNPLQAKLETLNVLLGKVNTWNIEKLGSSIDTLANLYGKNKDMVKFLITNFKEKDK